MRTVSQVSELTGVSVRTLHHYDSIGLLKPTHVTEAGYRLYDESALERLHAILLFRELDFPLKQIREILDTPGFDPVKALEKQIELLEEKRARLDAVIRQAKRIKEKGTIEMKKDTFDTYAREAEARWGKTDAWKEYAKKSEGRSKESEQTLGDGLMDIFRRLGQLRQGDPGSQEAQALVKELQSYITAHYYTCTPQILKGLGQMYAAGGDFTENIDKSGGPGTAVFAQRAIGIFTR